MANSRRIQSDKKINAAIGVLENHLKNHPTRERMSAGYQIEMAINLLKEAQQLEISYCKDN